MSDPRPNSPEDVGFLSPGTPESGRGASEPKEDLAENLVKSRHKPASGGGARTSPVHEPKECRSCGGEILWAQLVDERGEIVRKDGGRPKAIPVDFAPSEKGNVQLYDRGGAIVARVLGPGRAQQIRDAAWALNGVHSLRLAHFATCPNADQWRKS